MKGSVLAVKLTSRLFSPLLRFFNLYPPTYSPVKPSTSTLNARLLLQQPRNNLSSMSVGGIEKSEGG